LRPLQRSGRKRSLGSSTGFDIMVATGIAVLNSEYFDKPASPVEESRYPTRFED
jgi:hypothetical protein